MAPNAPCRLDVTPMYKVPFAFAGEDVDAGVFGGVG